MRIADRYTVVRELGRGGMGVVFHVRDEEVGEDVALKLIVGTSDPGAIDRFRREVRLARRVTHRNVTRTHDLGRDVDGRWFLTMELVGGGSLLDVLRAEAPLPPLRAAELVAQVADGLAAAHDVGVVHRDLKPANVLVAPDGRAVLTDFGIAVSLRDGERGRGGTPRYQAPEQLDGAPGDARSDLYALGLVLFESVTGRRAGLTPLRQGLVLPAVVEPIVRDLLEPDPARRPGSAAEVAERLRGGPRPAPHRPVVALAPLKWIGPPERGWLAEGFTDTLESALADVPGIHVRGGGSADGGIAGPLLRVGGTVQWLQDRVRFTVRGTDEAGDQRFSDVRELPVGDVLLVQEQLAARVAEVVRVQAGLVSRARPVPDGLVGPLLRARGILRRPFLEQTGPLAELDHAIERHGPFPPAVALSALLHTRLAQATSSVGPDLAGRVEGALRLAPDEPETWLAVAQAANEAADFERAVPAIRRSIGLAPGSPHARWLYGVLACESRRVEEGIESLERAVALEPGHVGARAELARQAALRGDRAWMDHWLRFPDPSPMWGLVRMRLASWFGDPVEAPVEVPATVAVGRFRVLVDGLSGRVDEAAMVELVARVPRGRMRVVIGQVVVECLARAGRPARAQAVLDEVAGDLLDLSWLVACPALDPLRDRPGFEDRVRQVGVRVARLWQAVA